MSSIQGLNPQVVTQLKASELGETAEVTSQQQPQVYDKNIQQSRAEAPPPDVDYSFQPVLDGPRQSDSTSNGQLYDRFNNTTDDFVVGLTTVIATLLHETGQEIRRAAREGRTQSIQAQAQLQRDQAQSIRDGAAFQLAAGVAGSAIQIGGAVASMSVASAGYSSTKSGENAKIGTLKNSPENAAGNVQIARGTQLNSIAQSTSGLAQGVQGLVSAPLNRQSQLEEAKRAELEAQRTELQQSQTEQNELSEKAQDLLREVRQRLSEIQSAENQVISRIYSV